MSDASGGVNPAQPFACTYGIYNKKLDGDIDIAAPFCKTV